MKAHKILLLIMFIFSTQLWAQSIGPEKELFSVDKIEVRGLKRIEKSAVLEKLDVEIGSIATNLNIKSSIQSLYDTKFFSFVAALRVQRAGENILTFRVDEKPLIQEIEIIGNDDIDEDDINEVLNSKQYTIFDIATVKKDIEAIKKVYQDKGFYLAEADHQVDELSNQNIKLIFNIQENNKVRIKSINLIGNKKITDPELKGFMTTKEKGFWSFFSGTGTYKEFDFGIDVERLKYFYRTKGFLKAQFGKPRVRMSPDKKWIFIDLDIDEGAQFKVRDIYFEGDLLYTEDELKKDLLHKSAENYNQEYLRADMDKLKELYQDKGFAFATVNRRIGFSEDSDEVDLLFSFRKGSLAKFGKVSVSGNLKTRDKVILRELSFQEGETFSGSKLRKSKLKINRLGYFERDGVVVSQKVSPTDPGVVDIDINIKERQTGQISLGAGYSSASKAFFQGQVSYNNFLGRGQNLNASIQWSKIRQTFNIGFLDPYFMDTKWSFGGDLYRTESSFISSFDFRKFGGNIKLGYPLSEDTRLFAIYRLEDSKIKELDDPRFLTNPGDDLDEVNEREGGVTSSVALNIIQNKTNNSFEPTRGHYVSSSLEYAGLGGDQKWMLGEVQARYYHPVTSKWTFRSRVIAAQLWEVGDKSIPRIEKFTMGGSRNLRGFDIEDIGPTYNEVGLQEPKVSRRFNGGGTKRVLGQFEMEYLLSREAGLKAVVFYDVGNVYNGSWFEDDQGNDFRSDIGLGFRWFSPLGVLRFEMGFPLDREDGESANQFHFDIGQLF